MKITQSRGNGVKRGKNSQFPESTKTIKGHDLALGSLLFLTKAAPSPRFRINPYVDYNLQTGRINLPEDIKKSVTKLDTMLRGREENTLIDILDESEALGEKDHESELCDDMEMECELDESSDE